MKKRIALGLLAALTLFSLTACGGGGDSGSGSTSSASVAGGADRPYPEAPMDMAEADFNTAEYEYQSAANGGGEDALQNAKMILTADLELETTAFEESAEGLSRLTEELEGYFETSSIRSSGGNRWANYVIRVPAKNYNAFLERAGELCHLTWQVTGQENITEAYYDAEGRLKTQQIKLERLQDLLSKAENMEDIITIESAISETEYQIEALSGQLRHYDALVDYATINLSLSEVYKLSNTEETPDSFGSRISASFAAGIRSFEAGMEDFAVWLAYSWLWLVILAALLFVCFRIARNRRRRAEAAWAARRESGAGKNPLEKFPPFKGKKTDDNPPET